MDLGIYPISLASMILGDPTEMMKTLANIGTTQVDEQAGWIFVTQMGLWLCFFLLWNARPDKRPLFPAQLVMLEFTSNAGSHKK